MLVASSCGQERERERKEKEFCPESYYRGKKKDERNNRSLFHSNAMEKKNKPLCTSFAPISLSAVMLQPAFMIFSLLAFKNHVTAPLFNDLDSVSNVFLYSLSLSACV